VTTDRAGILSGTVYWFAINDGSVHPEAFGIARTLADQDQPDARSRRHRVFMKP
jgi:hypothetical protein